MQALSSLCALGDLSIVTRTASQNVGTLLEFSHNNELKRQSPSAREVGTTVTLRNLFCTLPVRCHEFRRNARKEFARFMQLMHAYAIISDDVRFTVVHMFAKG